MITNFEYITDHTKEAEYLSQWDNPEIREMILHEWSAIDLARLMARDKDFKNNTHEFIWQYIAFKKIGPDVYMGVKIVKQIAKNIVNEQVSKR